MIGPIRLMSRAARQVSAPSSRRRQDGRLSGSTRPPLGANVPARAPPIVEVTQGRRPSPGPEPTAA